MRFILYLLASLGRFPSEGLLAACVWNSAELDIKSDDQFCPPAAALSSTRLLPDNSLPRRFDSRPAEGTVADGVRRIT